MSSKPRHSFFGSLLFRLTLAYTGVFSLVLIVIFFLISSLLTHSALDQTDRLILGEANRMLDLASRRKAAIIQSEIDRFIFHYGSNDVSIALLGSDGQVLARSEPPTWQSSIPPIIDADTIPRFIGTKTPEGRPIRTVILKDEPGHALRVSAAVDGLDQHLLFSQRAIAISLIASLLLGTTLAFVLTRRALTRIERIRSAAEARADGTARTRVDDSGGRDEVAALTATFNHMLERIDHTVDELRHVTDNMAHDLRTPLTRIRATAESALLDNTSPTQQIDALTSVLEECARLERMTGTLFQISRMMSGVYRPTGQTCDLDELARDAVDLLEPAFQDKGVGLKIESVRQPLTVTADRPVLERVLANLLDNALKFTPKGGRVHISTTRLNDTISVIVSDTGIGIEPGELQQIFERFHRTDSTHNATGLGLGLSFVKAAIQAHGGAVQVASTPGKGSVFTLTLPSAPGK